MSHFIRRWANWGTAERSSAPEQASARSSGTPDHGTDNADKSPSVSVVSGLAEHPGLDFEEPSRRAYPEISPEKRSQRTDKTDKSPSVSFVGGLGARSKVDSVAERCPRCQALEAQGVRILLCSCGYTAQLRPAPQPQPRDLVYSLAHVRQHAPDLSPVQHEWFDYWLDLYTDGGWSREDAERGAFRRAMHSPSAPTNRE